MADLSDTSECLGCCIVARRDSSGFDAAADEAAIRETKFDSGRSLEFYFAPIRVNATKSEVGAGDFLNQPGNTGSRADIEQTGTGVESDQTGDQQRVVDQSVKQCL